MSRDTPKYGEVAQVPGGEEKDMELKENGGPYTSKMAIGQVTIRLPLSGHPLNIIALLYGFLPWIVPITLVVYFVYTWHFIYLFGPLMSCVLAIINEGILKKVFNEPRPKESANKHKDGSMKPGMPSGHVLNATSIMVWALLEVYYKGPGLHKHQTLTMDWLVVILFVHLPVPWARWYNSDHSAKQCAVSGVLGLIVGALGFYLRVHYFGHAWKPWEAGSMPHSHQHIVSFWTPPWIATPAAPAEAAKKLLLL